MTSQSGETRDKDAEILRDIADWVEGNVPGEQARTDTANLRRIATRLEKTDGK